MFENCSKSSTPLCWCSDMSLSAVYTENFTSYIVRYIGIWIINICCHKPKFKFLHLTVKLSNLLAKVKNAV